MYWTHRGHHHMDCCHGRPAALGCEGYHTETAAISQHSSIKAVGSTRQLAAGSSNKKHKAPARARRDRIRWEQHMARKRTGMGHINVPQNQVSVASTCDDDTSDNRTCDRPAVNTMSHLNVNAAEFQPPGSAHSSRFMDIEQEYMQMPSVDNNEKSSNTGDTDDNANMMPFSECDAKSLVDECLDMAGVIKDELKSVKSKLKGTSARCKDSEHKYSNLKSENDKLASDKKEILEAWTEGHVTIEEQDEQLKVLATNLEIANSIIEKNHEFIKTLQANEARLLKENKDLDGNNAMLLSQYMELYEKNSGANKAEDICCVQENAKSPPHRKKIGSAEDRLNAYDKHMHDQWAEDNPELAAACDAWLERQKNLGPMYTPEPFPAPNPYLMEFPSKTSVNKSSGERAAQSKDISSAERVQGTKVTDKQSRKTESGKQSDTVTEQKNTKESNSGYNQTAY